MPRKQKVKPSEKEQDAQIFVPKKFKPLTKGHSKYAKEIEISVITICIGPSGASKSYTAASVGLQMLQEGRVEQLILIRPSLTCGENIGFLPGDANLKMAFFNEVLFAILREYLHEKELNKLIDDGKVKALPLAYLRGYSFHNAFVIVDEAQNLDARQWKLLLTRIGENSRMVFTADFSQSDLVREISGLKTVVNKLDGLDGVSIVRLGREDIVRNGIIKLILDRLEE